MSHYQRVPTSRLAAFVLWTFDMPILSRRLLRALMPNQAPLKSAAHHSRDRTSLQLGTVLYDFEKAGWLSRGHDYVRVLDRDSLLSFALASGSEHPTTVSQMGSLLRYGNAVRLLQMTDLDKTDAMRVQRLREARALMQLAAEANVALVHAEVRTR